MPFVTNEHLALIDKPGERVTASQPISEDGLRRFVQAVMETDPVHFDETAAAESKYGGLVAPPLYPFHAFPRATGTPDPLERLREDPDWDGFEGAGIAEGLPELELPLDRVLNGGVAAIFFRLAQPGDVITTQSRYVHIEDREGRSGPMVVVIVETEYTNQRDELLMRVRSTLIRR